MDKKWLIYGAYGYTGRLVVEEAVKRGHRPVLAGRSAQKLTALGEHYELDTRVCDLRDTGRLAALLADFDLVFHAAGPFIHTSRPMLQACLESRTHYLDITGEVQVIEHLFSLDRQARERGVALISGAGFDVVPSDCLACYVASKIEAPGELEIAFASPRGKLSPGTTKSMLEHAHEGLFARRDGELVRVDPATLQRRVRFSDRERPVMPITWGDLATAYRSTGIPNITVYTSLPGGAARRGQILLKTLQRLSAFTPARRLAQWWVGRTVQGPDEQTRMSARCYFWACARNTKGEAAEAWLETPEGYRLTAIAGVRCAEKLLAANLTGALTPAQAFGTDFVIGLPEVRRMDALPDSSLPASAH